MAGLLDNPKDAAMLQLGLGLLSRSGPSRVPVSIGQALGDAGQEAMGTYRQAQQDQQANLMRDMQMQELLQKQAAQKQKQEGLAKLMADPNIPQHIKAGVAAGVVDLGDLYKPQKLGEGDTLVSPIQTMMGGNVVLMSGAPKVPKLPPAVQEYEYAKGQGYKGTFEDFTKSLKQAGATTIQNYPAPMAAVNPVTGQTELVQFGNKGGARPTGFKPALDAKPPTEAESKAAFYAGNMRAASKVLDRLEKEGMDMSKLGSQVDTTIAGGMGNLVSSPRAQQARQAQNQWAEQMLRMQTGAAATQDEITRTVATYFPRPGDGPEVVKQKKEMRAQAEQGVFAASGRAQSRVPSGGGVKFLGFE